MWLRGINIFGLCFVVCNYWRYYVDVERGGIFGWKVECTARYEKKRISAP